MEGRESKEELALPSVSREFVRCGLIVASELHAPLRTWQRLLELRCHMHVWNVPSENPDSHLFQFCDLGTLSSVPLQSLVEGVEAE